ncbi:divalent-cation tolerance protein CutA [Lentzea flava]|uniref:Divalent cation tolerance protein n=1 Tax=Lentzea flava TaxID=103732 RepID=A0ABQ2USX3_9PSEU|nr:divalent-cation tolerance protein CutA [Lentzea flava]MCP2201534.1 divalent cation tolerance protein [Lentzea flava]GGU52164.1 divalent cation tolerance protein [Lentzea flava]
MSGASVVTTTVDSEEAAESLAKGIVEARLGACVQIVPIRSVYRWEGEMRVDAEWQCVVKTSAIRADELVAHIKAHHTYDVPEVIVSPVVGGNDDYLAWVSEETS